MLIFARYGIAMIARRTKPYISPSRSWSINSGVAYIPFGFCHQLATPQLFNRQLCWENRTSSAASFTVWPMSWVDQFEPYYLS